VAPQILPRRTLEELGSLQASVRQHAQGRNIAFRILLASRVSAVASAQREFWLEFAWLDQEYRCAVRRLARFCLDHRNDPEARWGDSSPNGF
jgi:hypothetical protein